MVHWFEESIFIFLNKHNSSKSLALFSLGIFMVARLLLESDLGFHNYANRFDLLLHLEEDQMRMDIKRYDKNDVSMERDRENRRLLVLEVSGVVTYSD